MARSAPVRAAVPGSYDVGLLLVRVRRQLWRQTAQALEAAGESMLAWQLIAQLERAGRECQRELALAIAMDPAGVSRCLDALEQDGCVRRTRDKVDRRRLMVELTARGRRRHATLLPVVADSIDLTLAPLGLSGRAMLAALLARCLAAAALNAPPAAPGPPAKARSARRAR